MASVTIIVKTKEHCQGHSRSWGLQTAFARIPSWEIWRRSLEAPPSACAPLEAALQLPSLNGYVDTHACMYLHKKQNDAFA